MAIHECEALYVYANRIPVKGSHFIDYCSRLDIYSRCVSLPCDAGTRSLVGWLLNVYFFFVTSPLFAALPHIRPIWAGVIS